MANLERSENWFCSSFNRFNRELVIDLYVSINTL